MVIKKLLIFFFLTFFFFIFIYLNVTFNRNKVEYKILKYKKITKIYIDRDYLDVSNSELFDNEILLQVSRHNYKKILFYTNFPVIIYRPTCPFNYNKIYGPNWNILKTTTIIKGFSCTHSKVYYKKFNGPFVLLDPGGPAASDPIFIKTTKKNHKIIVLNKRK
jgi:hypothetical protein